MERFPWAYADRSERGKLHVSGPQRAWFLHQVLTQAFEDIQPGEAREAAMITPHGRMIGHLEALATDDAILCHFEPELREVLPEQIRRYVFATQVEIDDVGGEMGLVLVLGDKGCELAARAAPDAITHPTGSLGSPAAYFWLPGGRVATFLAALDDVGLVPASEEELEAIRIKNGVPRWGREMDGKTFPQEAGIDVRAVHYDKGCYLGQEAMAKIHFRGKVNRRLARLEAHGSLRVGADVLLDGDRVGRVTSAADGRALALVRHTVIAGTKVVAGQTEARVIP